LAVAAALQSVAAMVQLLQLLMAAAVLVTAADRVPGSPCKALP
jgi:hypothetical protein